MAERNFSMKYLVSSTVAAVALFSGMSSAQAGIAQATHGTMSPMIVAGAPPDSPANRVDPNTADSRFSGVVSIQIKSGDDYYICSGALVGKRQVLSAGHCVDIENNGVILDLNNPNNAVTVVFNTGPTADGRDFTAIDASKISMHQDYQGFGNCPAGYPSGYQCLNDDLSVITLAEDAPKDAKIYKVSAAPVTEGTRIMMVGYGTTGNGLDGYTEGPDYFVKRVGENYMDLFDGDDEIDLVNGKREVWYADFDGAGYDTWCDYYGVCTPVLANDVEGNIGGGDSGGPSFIEMYGELMLVGSNTFGSGDGSFGNIFGGMVYGSYIDYLNDATGGRIAFVPEPTGIALFGLGALALFGARRRSLKK